MIIAILTRLKIDSFRGSICGIRGVASRQESSKVTVDCIEKGAGPFFPLKQNEERVPPESDKKCSLRENERGFL